MLIGGVVEHHLHDYLYPALVGGGQKSLEVVECAIVGMDRSIVRDVVSVIAERRRKERHQPQRIDTQFLQVIQFLREPAEVPDPVTIAIAKSADVHLVNNRVFVPKPVLRQSRCSSSPNYALSGGNDSVGQP